MGGRRLGLAISSSARAVVLQQSESVASATCRRTPLRSVRIASSQDALRSWDPCGLVVEQTSHTPASARSTRAQGGVLKKALRAELRAKAGRTQVSWSGHDSAAVGGSVLRARDRCGARRRVWLRHRGRGPGPSSGCCTQPSPSSGPMKSLSSRTMRRSKLAAAKRASVRRPARTTECLGGISLPIACELIAPSRLARDNRDTSAPYVSGRHKRSPTSSRRLAAAPLSLC
jgi:hypothetical protein